MKPVRVIQLLPTLGMGGAERVVFTLARDLPQHGFDVMTVGLFGSGGMEAAFRARGLPYKILTRRDRFGLRTIQDLCHFFSDTSPTIVHTHLSGPDTWGRVAASMARVPIVISTEHNTHDGLHPAKRFAKRLIASRSDAFVAVSDAVRRVMRRRDHLPAQKLYTIINGIDVQRIEMRPDKPFHHPVRLIAVGRLYPQKDHQTLLKALAMIKEPWQLTVVGTGPLEPELCRLAASLNIRERIHWLGERDDVPELLAQSDIFCFPSRWEGLGLAVLEAAAAGVPSVVSDLSVLREYFLPSDVCFVRPADHRAWARALRTIMTSSQDRLAHANQLAPSIRERFSSERMVEAHARLYRDLMVRKRLL